jgi:hypothetical protein
MDETEKDGRSSSQKTPEQIRAERIAAVPDPKLRRELEGFVKTREAHLEQVRDRQKETFDSRDAELRQQKINSANAPQLTPSQMRPTPYLGAEGQARAQREAELQVKSLDLDYLKKIAREHNDHIDKRLDAHRTNQIERTPSDRQVAEPVPAPRSRGPNRYAELIKAQNYTARANQAELDREKEQERTRQQQRQRGLDR